MRRALFTFVCAATVASAPIAAGAAQATTTTTQGTTTAKSGQDLSTQIERRIHNDASLKKHDIRVSLSGDVVTLSGTVASDAERSRAGRLAKMKGVTRVDNQITVERSARATSGTVDKAADKTKEGTNKVIDKSKEGINKGVDKSKEGVATAGEKSASGVKKVGSEIADAFVLASVKARLFGDDALKGSDINIDSDNHVITLKGTVPNEAARARAIELAGKTDGVDRVVDRMTIGPKK
jgi:osmotically-inducible protein OsmY